MTQEEKDILIAKIICSEANSEDLETSKQLIESDPSYKSALEKSKLAFIQLKNQPEFNSDAAWLKMKARLNKTSDKRIQLNFIIKNIAAVLLLIGIGSLIYFQMEQKRKGVAIQTETETKKEILPDGTLVTLNQHSKLNYQFNADKRTIQLNGEAFFEVKHDESKPFIVEVDELKITDIGTAFLVKENEDEKAVTIGVEEGIVMIEKDETNMKLHAGDQVIYHSETGLFEKTIKQQKIRPAYASKTLRFNRTPLYQVIQEIQDNYQLDIQLGTNTIQNCEITASFTDENPDIILQVICETLHLDMKKTNNQFILNGVGCN